MPGIFVARTPPRGRARLNLVPRWREGETLSSWLERLAGAYGLTLGEFWQWLGYPALYSYGVSRIDLDLQPPPDLIDILEQHTGVSSHRFNQQRLAGEAVLPLRLRRTFCPRCWMQDGPYRRREWASGWALVCTRHRTLLREKPPRKIPYLPKDEDSWLELYETPQLWRDDRHPWEAPNWLRICSALAVNPRAEFLRAYPWFCELQEAGVGSTANDMTGCGVASEEVAFPSGADTRAAPCVAGSPGTSRAWLVQRDLVIYGLMRFHRPPLLQILDRDVDDSGLLKSWLREEGCQIVVPEADYALRLFAASVARQVWEKLTLGRWRCGAGAKIAEVLGDADRWNDEEWWLERRLYSWPDGLKQAGRQLFQKEEGWTMFPPWRPCREYCTRHLPTGLGRMRVPSEGWRCRWKKSGEICEPESQT